MSNENINTNQESISPLKGIRANETGNAIIDNFGSIDFEQLNANRENAMIQAGISSGDYFADARTNGNINEISRDAGLMGQFGESKYDIENGNVMFDATPDKIQNQRFDNQWGITQVGLGIAKGVVLAGTTFLDGVSTLTYGIGKGIANAATAEDGNKLNAFGEGLWNNEVSKSMQAINEWAEDTFKNYYSTNQERGSWYSADNLISGNFLGDKLLKNVGFMVGAFYSGAAISKIGLLPKMMKAITQSNRVAKSTAAVTGSLVSAINEGSIEALNNATEWEKSEIEKAKLYTQEELRKIAPLKYYMSEEDYNKEVQRIQNIEDETIAKIKEDKVRMGNMDLLLNIPILTAENILAWGRLYSQGYKNATRFSDMRKNIRRVKNGEAKEVFRENLSKLENKIKHPGWEGTKSTIKRSVLEGNEEMAQGWASEFAGNRESQDVLAYHKAKANGEAYERNIDNWKANIEALHNTYGNGDRWEEFVIGALSSVFGMPKVRGVKNKETGKFQLPFSLEGGIRQDLHEARENQAKAQKIVDYVNDRLDNPKFQALIESSTGHEYWQSIMDDAAAKGDKKMFKDAESAQFINDLFMFHQAGMLDGLEEVIKTAGDLSDIESETGKANLDLIKSNDLIKDKNGKVVGSQRGFHVLDSKTGEWISKPDSEIVKDIQDRRDKLLSYIKDYRNTVEDLDYTTNGVLSDDQLKELTWYKMKSKDAGYRIGDMAKGLKNKKLDSDPDVSEISSFIENRIKKLNEKKELTKEDQKELEELNKHLESINTFLNEDFKKVDQNVNKYRDVILNFDKAINFVGEKMGSNKSKNYSALVSQMNDIGSLFSDIDKYNFLYDMYLSNPGLLEEQIENLRKQQEQENIKKVAKGIEEKLSTAKDQQEFRGILTKELNALIDSSSNPSEKDRWYRQQVEESIKNSENPHIKQMYNDMINHLQLASDIKNTVEKVFSGVTTASKFIPGNLHHGLYNILNSIFSDENLNGLKNFEDFKAFINRRINSPIKNGYEKWMPGILTRIRDIVEQVQTERNSGEKKTNNNSPEPDKKGTTGNTQNTQTTQTGSTNTNTNTNKKENFGITGSEELLQEVQEAYNDYLNVKNSVIEAVQNKNLDTAISLFKDLENLSKLIMISYINKASNEKDKWQKIFDNDIKTVDDGINRLRAEITNNQLAEETQNVDQPFDGNDVVADDTELTPEQQQKNDEQIKNNFNETVADIDKNSTPTKNTSILNQAKNWLFTWWDFNKLQEKARRKTKYIGVDKKTNEQLPVPKIVQFLQDHNSFEFIDRGGLADLNAAYRYKNKTNIPLNLVCVNELSDNQYKNVLICVEVTDLVNDYVKNHYKGIEPKTIETNGKRYIPLGVVSYYSKSSSSLGTYNNIVDTVIEEYKNAGSPNVFVSSYTSEVSHFYSGRFVLTDDEHPDEKERFLIETEFKDPKKLILGIGRRNREVRAPQLGTAKPKLLNDNVPLDMRAGSVWIMIKGSDGVNYPMATRVLRFNEKEYNWRNNQTSSIIKKIREKLAIVLNPNESKDARIKARDAIGKYIAFPTKQGDDKHIVFGESTGENAGKDIVSIKSISGKTETLFTEQYDDAEKRIDDFLDLLMTFNYKFNVDVQELKQSGAALTDYLTMLIQSNIITTNLITDHNVCGSFELSVLKNKDGEIVVGKEQSENPVNATPDSNINSHKYTYQFSYNGNNNAVTVNNDSTRAITADNDSIKEAAGAALDATHNPNTEFKQHKNIYYYKGSKYVVDLTNTQPAVYDATSKEGKKLIESWEYFENKENEVKNQTQEQREQSEALDKLQENAANNNAPFVADNVPTEISIPDNYDTKQLPNGEYEAIGLSKNQIYKQKIYTKVLTDGSGNVVLQKTTDESGAQYIVYEMQDSSLIYIYNNPKTNSNIDITKSNFNATFDNVADFSGTSQAERFFSTKEGRVERNSNGTFRIVSKTQVYGKPKQGSSTNVQPTIPVQNSQPAQSVQSHLYSSKIEQDDSNRELNSLIEEIYNSAKEIWNNPNLDELKKKGLGQATSDALIFNKLNQFKELLSKGINTVEDYEAAVKILEDIYAALNTLFEANYIANGNKENASLNASNKASDVVNKLAKIIINNTNNEKLNSLFDNYVKSVTDRFVSRGENKDDVVLRGTDNVTVVVGDNIDYIRTAINKLNKPQAKPKHLVVNNSIYGKKSRNGKSPSVEATPQTVINTLAESIWSVDDNGNPLNNTIECLEELSKFSTLTPNMTVDDLNNLAERNKSCHGLKHMRFNNSVLF